MRSAADQHEEVKKRTRFNASRMHQGPNHWHVRIRSKVIVCGECEAHIPRSHSPSSCPECGAGA